MKIKANLIKVLSITSTFLTSYGMENDPSELEGKPSVTNIKEREDTTTGLDLADFISVNYIHGTTLTTLAEANAYLANKRARVLDQKHLLSNVELSTPTVGVTDISNGARFDDRELAEKYLRDHVIASLSNQASVTESDK